MDSINSLMNGLTYKLISDFNLVPHKNQYGQYMSYGPYRVLEKAYINNVLIVKIINGDIIFPDQITNEISKSIDLIRERNLARLKPVNIHFVICAGNNYMPYKQMADDFSISLSGERISICITVINTFFNNVYTVNSTGYINDNIINLIYRSFGGRIIYENDIENILAGIKDYHKTITRRNKITVTKIIIGINVLFWLFGLISDYFLGYDIFKVLGMQVYSRIIYEKEYWRLLTPIFLHGGLIHMMSNSYFLLICGELVEKYIGRTKFAVLYLVTGILGNVASLFTTSRDIPSLGASGACMGIGGILVYMWINKEKNFLKYYNGITSLIIMIVINIFYGFTVPGIDNGAHIGGFLSGFILAFVIDKTVGLGKDKPHKIPLY